MFAGIVVKDFYGFAHIVTLKICTTPRYELAAKKLKDLLRQQKMKVQGGTVQNEQAKTT